MAERKTGSVSDNSLFDTVTNGFPGTMRYLGVRARVNIKRLIWILIAVAAGLGTYLYVSSPMTVQVVPVTMAHTEETLGATGRIRGEKSVDLGLDMSGVIKSIYVKNGDTVRAGQLLLTLTKSDLDASVDASRAELNSAEAELAKVTKGPLPSEIRQAQAQLEQAQSVGDARVAEAQAKLHDLQAGSRVQEIRQAQAELQRQKALLAKAESDFQRTKTLVQQGALAKSALDDAQTNVDTTRAAEKAQEQNVELLKQGSRPSQIAEAKASLAEAQATRDTGVRASREALNTLLSTPRTEDVTAARAKVDEARADLNRSLEMRNKADLKAPFDGVIADLPVEQGQSVTPGQKLITFQELSKPIIEVETDEANLKILRMGQNAIVSSDAYPGKTFDAIVYDLGSKVDPDRGTIKIKLRPVNDVSWLRSDLTVDVNIITERSVRRIILPPDCVTRFQGKPAVFVAKDGEATPVTVTTGATGPQGIVVFGNLKAGDKIIRNSARIMAGDSVHAVER